MIGEPKVFGLKRMLLISSKLRIASGKYFLLGSYIISQPKIAGNNTFLKWSILIESREKFGRKKRVK